MAEETQAKGPNAAKRLARLVAVQALYRASFKEESVADILKTTMETTNQLISDGDVDAIEGQPDFSLLSAIVQGVETHREALQEMIKGALDERIGFERMEIVLRSILLAGAFELLHHQNVPNKVIINDYVDVARGFFDSREPGLVNAVLDKLGQKLNA